MIQETVVTTQTEDGSTHIAPMGIHIQDNTLILAPYRPSTTLDNLMREQVAIINYTTDVRIFAGCFVGNYDWELVAAKKVSGQRLAAALAHKEVTVTKIEQDELRPRFHTRTIHAETHAPFEGFNRAQAAIIELAILVSRLGMLSQEKINHEIAYLKIAVDKTAGENERTAWQWLINKVEESRQQIK